jgi:hypothetical protein
MAVGSPADEGDRRRKQAYMTSASVTRAEYGIRRILGRYRDTGKPRDAAKNSQAELIS